MTTGFDTDPNTQTVAAAWASSPFGQPEREVRYGFADPDSDDSPDDSLSSEPFDAKRAVIAAALASGVIAGAALGVMLFDFSDAAAPTVVVPRSEGRLPAAPPAVPTETRTIDAPGPSSVVSEQKTSQAPIAPWPATDVGTPPVPAAPDTTVVVDIPIPHFPPLAEDPAEDSEEAEPDPPQPPDVPDLDFKLPEPPQPEPDPVPPTFAPDLTLAPAPNP